MLIEISNCYLINHGFTENFELSVGNFSHHYITSKKILLLTVIKETICNKINSNCSTAFMDFLYNEFKIDLNELKECLK